MAHDVFISYGREDAALMQQVEKALREAGLTIWTDRGIAPGSPSWKTAIEQAILDARCIVVLFSPDSSESRWVRAELDYADAQSKPIYPLLVRGDAANAVPFGFTTYQWIDVRDPARLQSGLAQLIAALRGESPALPTGNIPAARSSKRRLFLLAGMVLIAVVAAVSLLLINRNAQTVVAAIPTPTVNMAQTLPTTLPTMPPFTVPDAFKLLEGEHTLMAVPSNWSTDVEPAILSESLKNMAGANQNAADMVENVMESLDFIAIDMIRFQSAATGVEDVGVPLSYPIIEARQRSIYIDAVPNGNFVSRGLVEMPAGTMLMTEAYDSSLYLLSYSLGRGTAIYTVYFNGRVADTDIVNSTAEQIVKTFRVKE